MNRSQAEERVLESAIEETLTEKRPPDLSDEILAEAMRRGHPIEEPIGAAIIPIATRRGGLMMAAGMVVGVTALGFALFGQGLLEGNQEIDTPIASSTDDTSEPKDSHLEATPEQDQKSESDSAPEVTPEGEDSTPIVITSADINEIEFVQLNEKDDISSSRLLFEDNAASLVVDNTAISVPFSTIEDTEKLRNTLTSYVTEEKIKPSQLAHLAYAANVNPLASSIVFSCKQPTPDGWESAPYLLSSFKAQPSLFRTGLHYDFADGANPLLLPGSENNRYFWSDPDWWRDYYRPVSYVVSNNRNKLTINNPVAAFAELDKDKNRVVTKDEFPISEVFKARDANKNKQLDIAEWLIACGYEVNVAKLVLENEKKAKSKHQTPAEQVKDAKKQVEEAQKVIDDLIKKLQAAKKQLDDSKNADPLKGTDGSLPLKNLKPEELKAVRLSRTQFDRVKGEHGRKTSKTKNPRLDVQPQDKANWGKLDKIKTWNEKLGDKKQSDPAKAE